jgi:DNA-binding PadR family transcriptional regulator
VGRKRTKQGSFKGSLPLKPAELDVLLALAGGEMHGYGIRKEVEARAGGRAFGPGTLYRTLDGLLERGWVEEAGAEEEGGRRRRYYRITGSGMEAAAAEVGRLEGIVARARERGVVVPGFDPGPAMGGAQ